MKFFRRPLLMIAIVLALGAAANWWLHHPAPRYLSGDTAPFVALFAAPPARDSAQTRRELDELLEIQRVRSAVQVEAARADRKTRVERFFPTLGLPAEPEAELPLTRKLAERVEADERPYVRAAKDQFRRLRPPEIEPRLVPCIGDVRADLSYPSGHATYGYAMANLLSEMVPERRVALLARADEFAYQRMVCGVHFRSDIDAGRAGALWLAAALDANPQFRKEVSAAAVELRGALHLPPLPARPQ